MQLLGRDARLIIEPLLDGRPRVLERVFAAAPGVGDSRFPVMRRSYLAVVPRRSEARQEVGERN